MRAGSASCDQVNYRFVGAIRVSFCSDAGAEPPWGQSRHGGVVVAVAVGII